MNLRKWKYCRNFQRRLCTTLHTHTPRQSVCTRRQGLWRHSQWRHSGDLSSGVTTKAKAMVFWRDFVGVDVRGDAVGGKWRQRRWRLRRAICAKWRLRRCRWRQVTSEAVPLTASDIRGGEVGGKWRLRSGDVRGGEDGPLTFCWWHRRPACYCWIQTVGCDTDLTER